MSEEFGRELPVPDVSPAPQQVEPTGHPGVDAVLASLHGLDETPVEEQVAVLEAAHEALRSALADAGTEQRPH